MDSKPKGMVRRFGERDADPLLALIQRTIKTSYPPFYSPECVEFFCAHHHERNILDEARSGTVLVAEVDGALVATGTLAGSEIKRVFVDPSHQGEGWGRTIMTHLEEEARRTGLLTVELDASIPAKPFYDHLAYETVAEQERALRSDSLRYYRMKKSLSATNE